MLKKASLAILGLCLAVPTLYADNPFEGTTITKEESTSDKQLQSTKTDTTSKKDNENDLASYTFPITGTITYGKLRLREWPWGKVSNMYETNTKITVLGVSGEFYEVIALGERGYMHKNYISIPGYPASGVKPSYPGDTEKGGYIPKEGENKEKEEVTSDNKDSKESNEQVVSSTNGISASDFKKQMSSMETPSKEDIIKLASSIGISSDYVKILVGTTQREGYVKDTYLHYGWASAMINNKVTIKQMQGWDPGRSGDANYYSQANINKGYDQASSDVLKAVYLALKYRNTKICECNGMYKPFGKYNVPSSYNELYRSDKYNCCIYEKK